MTKKRNEKKIPIPEKLQNHKLKKYINKCVGFQYHGEKLFFLLSHALFSSFDIDDGTVLLMKTIAQKINFKNIEKVKDIGSGVGVIGIGIKKKYPEINITFTDRDSLALDFTEENCHLNKIAGYEIKKELGIENTDKKFDLIVSNIPAKIGDAAFEELIIEALSALVDNGLCAVVIIKAFENTIKNSIINNGGIIVYEETTSRHSVYHFKRGINKINYAHDYFSAYKRGVCEFEYSGNSYNINTVYNLSDFDKIGFQSLLAMNIIKNQHLHGECLFWNPVHGHIPVNIGNIFKNKISGIILGSRDLLQLKITKENLLLNKIDSRKIKSFHVSFTSDIKEKFQNIFILPDVTPFSSWEVDLLNDLYDKIHDDGFIIISSEIQNMNKILDENKYFELIKSEKMRGFSGILLQKK